MKILLFSLCLFSLAHAQIQIEAIVENAEEAPEATGEAVKVEAPEARGHGREGDAPPADRLFFLNGDRLSGDLVRVGAEEGLTWRHPDAAEPVVFGLENLKQVEFKGPFPADKLSGLTRIRLTNGDEYLGSIVSMNGEDLLLRTPYAGDVTLEPAMIRSIRPNAASSALYEGPKSLEEWTPNDSRGNKTWEYRKGALYSDNHNQTIGMDFDEFPDRASIEFDLAWRGNPQINIVVWSRSVKNMHENSYAVMLQNSYVRAYRYSNEQGHNDLGNTHFNELRKKSETEVRLLLNREEKEIMLFLDGQLVKSWRDAVKDKIKGDAILFNASGNSPMRISSLAIREWDGKMESGEGEAAADASDRLRLENGDSFSGSLTRIEEGVLHFRNDFAEFKVPVERVSELEFAAETRREPRRNAGDVRIRFPTRERITLDLDRLTEGRLTGASEAVGGLSLDAEFVSSMTFNPYDDRHRPESDDW